MLRIIFKGWHLLLAFAFATAGQSRLNLAQETAEVTLNFAAKAELDSSFENATAAAISTARPRPTTRQTPRGFLRVVSIGKNKFPFFEVKNVSIPVAVNGLPDEIYQTPRVEQSVRITNLPLTTGLRAAGTLVTDRSHGHRSPTRTRSVCRRAASFKPACAYWR